MIEGMAAQQNPITGAVETVLADPAQANNLWVGTANGGIWKTQTATNASPTWTSLLDVGPSVSISKLDFDRTVTSLATLIAGIGHVSNFGSLGSALNGVIRSEDGGNTWKQLGTVALAGLDITSVAARGAIILVTGKGARGGVWRSVDTGSTFFRQSADGVSGLLSGDGLDLVGDLSNLNRFYAAVAGPRCLPQR